MTLDEALQAALAGEHAAVWAYAVVAARAPRSLVPRALADLGAHRAQRDALTALLQGRGAVPVASEPGYAVPAGSAAQVAAAVELASAATYADVLGVPAGAGVATLAGQALTDAAQRAARWAGTTPAFPGLPGR